MHSTVHSALPWLAAATLLALAACTTPPSPPGAPAAVLAPPAALRIEGAPPLAAGALAPLAR
jgi:hypothetical protein